MNEHAPGSEVARRVALPTTAPGASAATGRTVSAKIVRPGRDQTRVKAVATDEIRTPKSRTLPGARASRPCCRKRHRPACGTNSSWALAAAAHSRDSTHSREAPRPVVRRRRPRSRGSAHAPWIAGRVSQSPESRPQVEQ
jgi:hypothetical protein